MYILKGLFRLLGNDFGWDMTKDRENSYTMYNVEITLMFMFSSLQNSQIHGLIDHKGLKRNLEITQTSTSCTDYNADQCLYPLPAPRLEG